MIVPSQAKDRLIFALDFPDRERALSSVKQLNGLVGCFKVGLELFISEGPSVIDAIQELSDADIFLDLKLHDIPATMRGALRSAARHGVRFVTVHCQEGEVLSKTTEELSSAGLEILAVSVLTSLSGNDLQALGIQEGLTLSRLAVQRAVFAKEAGCAGVVCSGKEVSAIRQAVGDGLHLVVPGIRPEWSRLDKDDQSRITTPTEAIRDGADYLVVGRPIRKATDPKEAARKILDEIASALS